MSSPPEADRQQLQDVALIQQIINQNQTALAQLYDRYARIVYAVAYRSLGSAEESEEVVLDVFAQVWKIAHHYDVARSRVDTWLFMLARSRILDRLRRSQRVDKIAAASLQAERSIPAATPDPIEDVAIHEQQKRVWAALAQLPLEQRHVIELAYYQGMSHREIAAITQLSLGTVKTRIRLGLSKLRILLGRWEMG